MLCETPQTKVLDTVFAVEALGGSSEELDVFAMKHHCKPCPGQSGLGKTFSQLILVYFLDMSAFSVDICTQQLYFEAFSILIISG